MSFSLPDTRHVQPLRHTRGTKNLPESRCGSQKHQPLIQGRAHQHPSVNAMFAMLGTCSTSSPVHSRLATSNSNNNSSSEMAWFVTTNMAYPKKKTCTERGAGDFLVCSEGLRQLFALFSSVPVLLSVQMFFRPALISLLSPRLFHNRHQCRKHET